MFVNSDFSELLRLFNANGVRYLVVGGYAVMQHSEPRYTKDLDVWIATDESNAAAIFAALREFGAPLANLSAKDFAEEGYFYQMGNPPVRVDVLMGIPGVKFEDAWVRRAEFSFDDLKINFISKEDLIAAKLAAGRPQKICSILFVLLIVLSSSCANNLDSEGVSLSTRHSSEFRSNGQANLPKSDYIKDLLSSTNLLKDNLVFENDHIKQIGKGLASHNLVWAMGEGLVPRNLVWSSDSRIFAVSTTIGVYLFDSINFKTTIFLQTKGIVKQTIFSPDSQKIYVLVLDQDQQNRFVEVFDVNTGEKSQNITISSRSLHRIANLIVDTTDIWIVECCSNERIFVTSLSDQTKAESFVFAREPRDMADVLLRHKADNTFWQSLQIWVDHGSTDRDLVVFSENINGGKSKRFRDIWRGEVSTDSNHKNVGMGWISASAVNSSFTKLAIVASDNHLRVWDTVSGQLTNSTEIRRGFLSQLAVASFPLSWHPTKSILAIGGETLQFLEGDSLRLIKEIDTLSTFTVFSPNGNLIAAIDDHGTMSIFDVATGNLRKRIEDHSLIIEEIVIGETNSTLFLISRVADGSRYCLDRLNADIKEVINVICINSESIQKLHVNRKSGLLSAAVMFSDRSEIYIWDMRSLKVFNRLEYHGSSDIFTPDGNHIAVLQNTDEVSIWEIKTGRNIYNYVYQDTISSNSGGIICYRPDRQQIAIAIGNSQLVFWDISTRKIGLRIQDQHEIIYAATYSPDSKWFLVGGSDNEINVWDVVTGKLVMTLSGHKGWVTAMAFSSDSKYAISGDSRGELIIWEIASGRIITKQFAHNSNIKQILISDNDEKVVTLGEADGVIHYWNLSDLLNKRLLQ